MAAGGGAFQSAGCPSSTVGAGRSVAFSSFGAPCMIRAEQGRDRPCLPPVSRGPDEGPGRPAALRLEGGGVRRPEVDPATSQHSEKPALAGPGLHGPRPPPPRPASRSPPPLQGAPRSSRLRGAVAAAALSGRTRPARLLPRALALFRPPPGSSERAVRDGGGGVTAAG